MEGFWEFPGGKIEQGESPETCLIREIREELGINIVIQKHFMDSLFHYKEKSVLLKAYLVACNRPCKTVLKDHDQVLWVNKEELLKFKFAPADVAIINALVEI